MASTGGVDRYWPVGSDFLIIGQLCLVSVVPIVVGAYGKRRQP